MSQHACSAMVLKLFFLGFHLSSSIDTMGPYTCAVLYSDSCDDWDCRTDSLSARLRCEPMRPKYMLCSTSLRRCAARCWKRRLRCAYRVRACLSMCVHVYMHAWVGDSMSEWMRGTDVCMVHGLRMSTAAGGAGGAGACEGRGRKQGRNYS